MSTKPTFTLNTLATIPSLTKQANTRPKIGAIHKRFSPSQTLEYFGSVSQIKNEKLFSEFKKRLARDPEQEIVLTVSSPGGPTGAGMTFYDMVRHILRVNLTTIGTGDVDSSGIIVFLAGTRRIISKNTTLLFHPAGRRFDPNARFTASEMEAMVREDRLKDLQYATVVAQNSSTLTPSDVLFMMERQTVLSPDEMISYGLAHEVLA